MKYVIEGDPLKIANLLTGAQTVGILTSWFLDGPNGLDPVGVDPEVMGAVQEAQEAVEMQCVDCGNSRILTQGYYIVPPGPRGPFLMCPDCWERMVAAALEGARQ